MTAPAESPELDLRSADGGARARLPDAAYGRPTGPDLLAEAAVVLPVVVGRGPVRWVDVHAAIYRAACIRGAGRDRPHRLRLADEALDMFVEYLLGGGLAAGQKHPDYGWLAHRHPVYVQLTLAAAAGHWRRHLAAALAVA